MAKKQIAKPISPFYRAVFPIDTFRTTDGHEMMDKNWGRAIGFVLARHRCGRDHNPYCIPNEYICARLGTSIGLPIPPFALSKYADGAKRLLFSSLDFNPASLRLPPILPDVCMAKLAFECAGVVVFDVWVVNEDRHDQNLAVDKTLSPKVLRVWDHDMALFGGFKISGPERLEALRDKLGVTDRDITGGTEHCLLPHLTSSEHLDTWTDRIQSVPEWLIVDTCKTMVHRGITKAESQAAIAFLLSRQHNIRDLIFGQLCKHCGISKLPKEKQRSLFEGVKP